MKNIQLVAPSGLPIIGYVNSHGDVSPVTCKLEDAGGQNLFFYELPEDRLKIDNPEVLVDSDGSRWPRMDVEIFTLDDGLI